MLIDKKVGAGEQGGGCYEVGRRTRPQAEGVRTRRVLEDGGEDGGCVTATGSIAGLRWEGEPGSRWSSEF